MRLPAVALALAGVNAAARGEGPFTIYEMICRTPEVQVEAERFDARRVPLVTKARFFDIEADRLDLERYGESIWTPGYPVERVPCMGYPFGIPEGWDDYVLLDFEEWDPIRFPEDFPPARVERRLQEYLDLIEATRELRPNAKVGMFDMLRADPDNEPQTAEMEREIAAQCDATAPSMYVKEGYFWHDWTIHHRILQRCLEVKAATGLEVYPVVWNRYRSPPFRLRPNNQLRAHVQFILQLEHAGQRVDGVFMFGDQDSEDEATNVLFVRAVGETVELVAERIAPVEAGRHNDPPHPPQAMVNAARAGTQGDPLGRFD